MFMKCFKTHSYVTVRVCVTDWKVKQCRARLVWNEKSTLHQHCTAFCGAQATPRNLTTRCRRTHQLAQGRLWLGVQCPWGTIGTFYKRILIRKTRNSETEFSVRCSSNTMTPTQLANMANLDLRSDVGSYSEDMEHPDSSVEKGPEFVFRKLLRQASSLVEVGTCNYSFLIC